MKILGIIPARGGSKGISKKNIKLLGEHSLLYYSFQSAQKSFLLDKIILSSENSQIISTANSFGLEAPFVRPENLALDTTSSIEVVQHAISFFENEGQFFDAICLLQPTSPFREIGFIDKAIQTFINKNTDALISVLEVPHDYNPHWTFESNQNDILSIATGDKEIIKRRQDLPKAFFRDGSIYITKVEVIKKGSFFGETLSYIESNPDFYANIDTENDWKNAEEKLTKILSYI